jgi:hypothetical protein
MCHYIPIFNILLTDSTKPEDIEGIGSLLLNLSTIRAATDNFADSNWVGEGGFGAVYKVPHVSYHFIKCFSSKLQQLKA